MKKLLTLCIAVTVCMTIVMLLSCNTDDPEEDPQIVGIPDTPVCDYEGNTYQTVKIGNQIWMAENLKARFTSDGTEVPEAYSYNNNESNIAGYGRLYTWEAAKEPFIEGWHLPSEAEWNILENTLEVDVASKLKTGGISGFEAQMAGYRDYTGGYVGINELVVFWTSTLYTEDHALTRGLSVTSNILEHGGFGFSGGGSVRLLKNQ